MKIWVTHTEVYHTPSDTMNKKIELWNAEPNWSEVHHCFASPMAPNAAYVIGEITEPKRYQEPFLHGPVAIEDSGKHPHPLFIFEFLGLGLDIFTIFERAKSTGRLGLRDKE